MPLLRLDRIMASSGLFTRSVAAALIRRGSVCVNGQAAKNAADKCDTETDRISVDGVILEYRKFRYIVMNKPIGYVSSTADRDGKTVLELLDAKYKKIGLFPAGRLDKDAEGLLLLTNDGKLAHEITSPSKQVYKRYFVQIEGCISEADVAAFSEGLVLRDGTRCRPAFLESAPDGAIITLHEGKYHQVKRMMSAVGKPVKYLKRLSIGGLSLNENMKPGEYCEISDEISVIFGDK